MEEKKQYHKPAPGIPEALHPEIGNHSAMETDQHSFLLRTPDPLKLLDSLLSIQEMRTDETPDSPASQRVKVNAETTIVPPTSSKKSGPTSSGGLQKNPTPEGDFMDDANPEGPKTDENLKEVQQQSEKPKKKKVAKRSKTTTAAIKILTKASQPKEKPQKAGKLLRKAAKSINKQEEGVKTEKPEEVVSPAIALSPFTSWLKNLTGSEYVHPYEDDFAFEQASGSGKEGMSETFADLLAAQGYKDQAREMYLRLMEKYPEKSSFFAAKIEALQ